MDAQNEQMDALQNTPQVFTRKESFFSKVTSFFSQSPFKRIGFAAITVVLVGGIGVSVYVSQQQTNTQQHASATDWQGNAIYDACGTYASCYPDLDELHEAGFSAVLDYLNTGWTSSDEIQAYAQRAAQDNIKIIWSLKDFYTTRSGANPGSSAEYKWITSNCNCNTWNGAAEYIVNLVKNDPATWGYYIADEPSSQNSPLSASQVASLSNAIHAADPSHPRLLVNDDSLDTNSATRAVNLDTYQSSADVLAEDFYPVSFGLNINIVKDVMNETQYIANTYGKKSAIVLEVNSDYTIGEGATYPAKYLPSVSQMESMYNQARSGYSGNNPDFVIWYTFVKTPATQFGNLVQAIHQGSMYGTCSNQALDFCTTDSSFGVVQYTGHAENTACGITATKDGVARGTTIYCCKIGTAKYGGCTGSGGQGVCTTSCSASNVYYSEAVPNDACSIAGTVNNAPRGQAIYCSCASGNCSAAVPTGTPTPTPVACQPTNLTYSGFCGGDNSSTCGGDLTGKVSGVTLSWQGCSGVSSYDVSYLSDTHTVSATSERLPTVDCEVVNGTGRGEGFSPQYQNTNVSFTVCNSGTTHCTTSTFTPPVCLATNPTTPVSPTQGPTDVPSVSPTGPSTTPLVGDINKDGAVDVLDYQILMGCYGLSVGQSSATCQDPSVADLNGDGQVDGVDYNILLRAMIQNLGQ